MSASFSALRLGYIPWSLSFLLDPSEIDESLERMRLLLPALGDRITEQFERRLEEQLERISLIIHKIHRERASGTTEQEWIVGLVMCQKKKRNFLIGETKALHSLLAGLFTDERLQGYFLLGSRFGEVLASTHQRVVYGCVTRRDLGISSPEGSNDDCYLAPKEFGASKQPAIGLRFGDPTIQQFKPLDRQLAGDERSYILAGLTKLTLPERLEIEQFFLPADTPMCKLLQQTFPELGRHLETHEADLLERPKWDRRTISYRGHSLEVKLQEGEHNESILPLIFQAAEDSKWANPFDVRKLENKNEKAYRNAIDHFERRQNDDRFLEFSMSGDLVYWGPPGTVKNRRT